MDTYNVNLAANRVPGVKRLRSFLAHFAICVTVYWALELADHWLWPGHRESDTALDMLIRAALFGLLLSISFYFRKAAAYQILVDDEEICTKNLNSMNRLYSRTVRRGQVRTLIEKESGLLISRHNRIGTFFWGGIWVPKQLADYEYLKRLASEWK